MNFTAPFHALLKCNRASISIAKSEEAPISWPSAISLIGAIALAIFCSACATTQPVVDTNVQIDFPPTSHIESVEQANAVLDAVYLARAQIEWRYQQQERICYDKFWMNSCLLKAKGQRRIDLAKIKKSEVEANFFKRKNTVEEMDRKLLERNKKSPFKITPDSDDKPEPDNSASDNSEPPLIN